MYQIALCDDEEKEQDRIEAYLQGYCQEKQQSQWRIRRFFSGEELIQQITQKEYAPDLVLLDIFLSGITGVETAETMRRIGLRMPIIFLTTSRDHALHAYEVDAIQYLVKPVDRRRFFCAVDSAMEKIKREKPRSILIKTAGGVRQLFADQILYCESQKNYQVLHLASAEYKVRMTMESLWKLLGSYSQFGRCGRSYILNMDHVIFVEREEIAMDNGYTIYIPRNKAAEFKKAYFAYYFKQAT